MCERLVLLFLCAALMLASASAIAAPIHDAASKGDVAGVTALLNADPSLVNAADKDGATPLHYAVAAGRTEVVQLLLDRNTNVNAAKQDGVTALHVAASIGYPRIVGLLSAHGADPGAKDKLGRTPLSLARSKGNREIADLLQPSAGTGAENSGTRITCDSLKKVNPPGKWLTIPESRLVVNPTLNSQQPLPKELMPSLPMQVGYYCGEEPVRLPMLWMWQPGGREAMQGSITDGGAASFDAGNWQVDGLNADFRGSEVEVTLTGNAAYNFGCITQAMTVDLDKTPYVFVDVSSSDHGWTMKANLGTGETEVYLVRETRQTGGFLVNIPAVTRWTGTRTINIKLYGIGEPKARTVFTSLRFLGLSGSVPAFTQDSLEWYPHKLVENGSSSQSGMKVRTVTQFMDESSILQSLLVTEGDNKRLVLVGDFPYGTAGWSDAEQGVVLKAKGFHAVIKFGRTAKWLGTYQSWIDWLQDAPSSEGTGEIWAVEFDGLKKDDSVVVATRFEASALSPDSTLSALRRAVQPGVFGELLKERRDAWEDLLSKVPHPMDFGLHLTERKDVSPEEVRRMYYEAWVMLLSNSIPPMPENGYAYPQFSCGKGNLWREGHPKARPSSQWETFIAAHVTAGVISDTAWDVYEGMMSLVADDGSMLGEGLPARAAQAAWVLYSLTGDREKLENTYPAMKRYLLWKGTELRWLYGDNTAPDQKMSGFTIHALVDMTYARRIAEVLGMSEEVAFWQKTIAGLYGSYVDWFWSAPGGPFSEYYANSGKRAAPGVRHHLTALALPPDVLTSDIRKRLVDAFPPLFEAKKDLLVEFWRGYPDFSHYARGLWQNGFAREVTLMLESAMRGITRTGVFAEGYSVAEPTVAGGVIPEVAGAATMIESTMWRNGVVACDGLPVIVHVPSAVGVENVKVRTGTISIRFDQSGDGVEIWGNGLKGLNVPAGFEAGTHSGGTISWKGKLPVGQQIRLEDLLP